MNFVVLEYTTRKVDVYGFDKNNPPASDIPVVSGATAYDDPITGQTYILVINEALYYGSRLDHTLINPNQIRHFGIPLWDNPYDPAHTLSVGPIDQHGTLIPLQTKGTRIFFNSRSPSSDELATCPHVHLTSKDDWNPPAVNMNMQISDLSTTVPPDGLKEVLTNKMKGVVPDVHRYDDTLEDLPTRQTYSSSERHAKISAEVLADRFGIGIERARQTIRNTH